MDQRLKQIIAETDRYRITGFLRLPPEGYRSRLSDYLNAPDRAFLPLTDVEMTPVNGTGEAEQHKFVALALSHVVWAAPLGEDDD